MQNNIIRIFIFCLSREHKENTFICPRAITSFLTPLPLSTLKQNNDKLLNVFEEIIVDVVSKRRECACQIHTVLTNF